MQVRTPEILRPPVWPPPRSLATTSGISVDVFSSPYLDVSVQAVPHVYLFDSAYVTLRWVSPFGNLRISAHLQLPEAYRSLSRPSSAPDAKAFPLRSFMLDLPDEAFASSFRSNFSELVQFLGSLEVLNYAGSRRQMLHILRFGLLAFALRPKLIRSALPPLGFKPACAGL